MSKIKKKVFFNKMNWTTILSIIIILLLIINLVINVYLIYNSNKPISDTNSESFCNCFGPQYDGVEANPEHKKYYGGYCYNKDDITGLYQKGFFDKNFPGV